MYAHELLSANFIHQARARVRREADAPPTSGWSISHIRKPVSNLGTLVSSVDLKTLQHLEPPLTFADLPPVWNPTAPYSPLFRSSTMNDSHVSAATLLDGVDLARDDPQIVQTIVSILKAPDYPQLFSTFHGEDPQSPPEKAVKFVNALNKACVSSPPCLVCNAELTHPRTCRR